MADVNTVIIQGKIPKFENSMKIWNEDDEKKAVLALKVGSATSQKDDNGYYKEEMIDVKFFGKTAQNVHRFFKPGDKIIVQGSLVGGKYRYQNGAPVTDESGRKIFDGAFVRGITFSFCGSNGSSENGKSGGGSTKTTQEIFDPLADIPVADGTKKNLKKSPIPNLEDIDVDGFF